MKPNNTLNPRRFTALRVALLGLLVSLTFIDPPAAAKPAPPAAPQAPAAQQAVPGQVPAQNPGICGNQPFGYETQDFAAVVTYLRISQQG
jgi:hypothetical protein